MGTFVTFRKQETCTQHTLRRTPFSCCWDPGKPGGLAARGPQPEAGAGRRAPNQGTEESGRKQRQVRPSGQRHARRSFGRPLSGKSQVHRGKVCTKRWPKGTRPPTPRCRQLFSSPKKLPLWHNLTLGDGASFRRIVLWAPREEAQRAHHLLPGACLGGAAGKAPPTNGQMLPEVLPGGPSQKNFSQERQRIVCLFVFTRPRGCFYLKFVNIVRTLRERGGRHRHVPAGNPWPQESHLRPGRRGCQASRLPWVSGIEPGQGLEEVGDTFEGTVVPQQPRGVLPL